MKANCLFLTTSLLMAVLTSCSNTSNSINEYNLTVQGIKMRTTGAMRTGMFYTGTVDSSGRNKFSPYAALVVPESFKAEVLTSMDIDDVKNLKGTLSSKGIPGLDQPGVDIENGTTTKSSFVILGSNDLETVLRILNDDQNRDKLEYLQTHPDPRVITVIATTLNYDSTHTAKVKAGATVDLKLLGAGSGTATVDLQNDSKKTVKFSDRTVFAYNMSIPVWKRDKITGRLMIDSLVDDRPSSLWQIIFGGKPKLPTGGYLDPAKVP